LYLRFQLNSSLQHIYSYTQLDVWCTTVDGTSSFDGVGVIKNLEPPCGRGSSDPNEPHGSATEERLHNYVFCVEWDTKP